MLAITGAHPYRKFPAEGKGWIVGIDNQRMKQVDIPAFKKFLPARYKPTGSWSKQDLIQTCEADGRNWQIQFKSGEMDITKFMGEAIDWIWIDEEPKYGFEEKYAEMMLRLMDKKGIWWMTATPILGTAFLKKLSEMRGVFATTSSVWDNPYIPEEEIQRILENECLTQEDIDVRIEGKYIIFGGRPVFNVRLLNGMLDKAKAEAPAMQGVLETVAA